MTSTTTDVFLSDLVPFNSYVCRVAARTTIGAGPYSMATSFLTMETGMLYAIIGCNFIDKGFRGEVGTAKNNYVDLVVQ